MIRETSRDARPHVFFSYWWILL